MPGDLPIVAIVDDDVAARRALSRLLASQRYRVKQFSSAEQYLESAETNDAFCVVIDIDLGEGMSGIGLGRAIQVSERPIPIIFITGSMIEDIREQAQRIGCVDFLEKPCQVADLLAAIEGARAAG